ncbi:antibiotic biosynthesis monooxygenase [Streptomyces sp. NPDC047017]|uniref:antibiotic biosynthesis monooxygenase n=1 Tax=Streptomyces sp. NPDC047017 TaxID=3155024 RepID=UPI0033E6DBB5
MTAVSLEHTTVPADTGEVTLLIARRVDPGHEAAFERWARGILDTAATFPGHLGYGFFRSSGGDAPWFLVHRFQDAEACRAWQESPERAAWFADCDGHHHTEIARRTLTGMETWFAKPGSTRPAPPRWKMAISATLAIYPVSVLGGLFLVPHLTTLPVLLSSAVTACTFNVFMTYVSMPAVSRLLRGWLTSA